jgi:hypothetical protein
MYFTARLLVLLVILPGGAPDYRVRSVPRFVEWFTPTGKIT